MTEIYALICFSIQVIRLIRDYPKGLASRRKFPQLNYFLNPTFGDDFDIDKTKF